MGEVDLITVMIEGHREGQRVVVGLLLPQAILIVGDAIPATDPAYAPCRRCDARVLKWPHALVVNRRWLHHVDNVETILGAASRVANTEKIPLSVRFGIVVGVQDQVIPLSEDCSETQNYRELARLPSPSRIRMGGKEAYGSLKRC